jgi:choline dehydrogenase-like flavoprotein
MARVAFKAGAKTVFTLHVTPPVLHSEADIAKLDSLAYGELDLQVFSAHVMGGCPMGKDPKRSVVDSATLRHHELDNLFVIDGSVYPTSLSVNPQLSIYGLASWASEHVKQAV